MRSKYHLIALACTLFGSFVLAESKNVPQTQDHFGHIASIYISETFLNEQITEHFASSDVLKKIMVEFDPEGNKLLLKGRFQVPLDEFKAKGIDPRLMQFNFKFTVKPKLVDRKYIVLEFPLAETYFYPAHSRNPEKDRVIIPVQLLSLGVASIRGYLSALSGDFTSFDRKIDKLTALRDGVERNITVENNDDAKKVLIREKRSLELQILSTTLEKEKFEQTAAALSKVFGTDDIEGENKQTKVNLNEQIKARDNAIMLQMKIKNIVPYLEDIELGDIKIARNTKDGHNESYFIMYLKSRLIKAPEVQMKVPYSSTQKFSVPPAISIRLNQALFTSTMLNKSEQDTLEESKVKDFQVTFRDDGIHVTGKARKLFFHVPFDTLVDFVSTGPNEFYVKVRDMKVFIFDLKFLSPIALRVIRNRLNKVFEGLCQFQYVGKRGKARALKVSVNSEKLLPAMPEMKLVDVKVKDGNFMLRLGKTENTVLNVPVISDDI